MHCTCCHQFSSHNTITLTDNPLTENQDNFEDAGNRSRADSSVAMVDPLLFHELHLDTEYGLPTLYRTVDKTYTAGRWDEGVNALWGFFSPFSRRLAVDCKVHCVQQMVLPVYMAGSWSVAVINNLQAGSAPPSILLYIPQMRKGDISTGSTLMGTVMQEVVTSVLKKIRPEQYLEGTPLIPVKQYYSIDGCSVQESGMRIYLFMKNYKKIYKVCACVYV